MASVKIAVSLPEALFDDLERAATTTRVGRSRVIADALREYLGRQRTAELRERINRAYETGPDAEERGALDAHRRIERASSDARQ